MVATDNRSLYHNLYDDNKKIEKVKDLFVDGDQTHVNCVKETILNMCLFLVYLCPRYKETYVYTQLQEYLKILNSPGGEGWMRVTIAQSPYMKHSLLCDCQQILQAC